MLSIVLITAITAVALPHTRLTTLCVLRTMVPAYALAAILVVQGHIAAVTGLFNDAIAVDSMGSYMAFAALLAASSILSFYSSPVLRVTGTSYSLVILSTVMLFGAYFLAMSTDLITLALSLELQSFSLYALTSLYRWREGSTAAGLMYFMLGAFSSGLVLLGVSLAYAYAGTTSLAQLGVLTLYTDDRLMTTALVITMAGFLFKVTAAPFHYWGPEVYDRTPTAMTVFINVMPKFALVAVIARFSNVLASAGIQGFLGAVVCLSWIVGSVVGLVQTRIKRLLAYSTVNHVGWMLGALLTGSAIGFGAMLFYVLQYSATTTLTFLTLLALSSTRALHDDSDVELISAMNGLTVRATLITLILGVSLFSAAGIPPMIGFYAKLSVMQAMLFSLSPLYVGLGVLTSVVSAGYYLSVIAAMVFKPIPQA